VLAYHNTSTRTGGTHIAMRPTLPLVVLAVIRAAFATTSYGYTPPPAAYMEASQFATNLSLTAPMLAMVYQPVVFTIIYMSDGTGLVSFASLVKQVDQLNRAYSGLEATLAKYAAASDANVRFYFHSVQYIQDDEFFANCALENYQPMIKMAYGRDQSRYYNVYVCNVAANLGLSWYPYENFTPFPCSLFDLRPGMPCPPKLPMNEGHYMLGSMLDYQLLPGNNVFNGRWSQGDILTHETGHYYGIKHLYDGNCLDYGTALGYTDDIPDTPRQTGNPSGTCAQLAGTNSCPGVPVDDNANYMGIAADSCRSHFTPGQIAFMRSIVHSLKPTLQAGFVPQCVTLVDATDNAPDAFMCAQAAVLSDEHSPGNPQLWCQTDATNASLWGFAWYALARARGSARALTRTHACSCMDATGAGCPDWSLNAASYSSSAFAQPRTTSPTTKSPTSKAPTPHSKKKKAATAEYYARPVTMAPSGHPPTSHALSVDELYAYAQSYYAKAALDYANFPDAKSAGAAQAAAEEALGVYYATEAALLAQEQQLNATGAPTVAPVTAAVAVTAAPPGTNSNNDKTVALAAGSGGAGLLGLAAAGLWARRRRRARVAADRAAMWVTCKSETVAVGVHNPVFENGPVVVASQVSASI